VNIVSKEKLMSSKNLSFLDLPPKLVAVPTHATDPAASATPNAGPFSPEASSEALKICYRLLASMSEVDGTILVTGMGEESSTSRLSVQIAVGLSQVQSEKVLLVDAELPSRALAATFGVKPQPGLSELIAGSSDFASCAREVTPKLFLLPAGAIGIDASQFASTQFAALIERQLRREFRYVIIHSSPFGESAAANLLAVHSDGVVLAIHAGQHHRDELSELKKDLSAIHTKLLGVILVETIPSQPFKVPAPSTRLQKVLQVAALAAAGLGVGYAAAGGLLVPSSVTANAGAPTQEKETTAGAGSGPASTSAATPAPYTQASLAQRSEPGMSAVTGIRHWSQNGVTTVAIDLQSEAEYETLRLVNPDRICIEFHDTALAPSLNAKRIEVGDDLLERIRVAQPPRRRTRIVLDTRSVPDFSMRMERKPYRLMIEVRRRPAKLPPSQPKAEPSEPDQIPARSTCVASPATRVPA
jgi:Mrp family chromosome partitioning ATPase